LIIVSLPLASSATQLNKKMITNYNDKVSLSQRSFFILPFSNGYSAGIYDAEQHEINAFYDMIYLYFDPKIGRKNLLNSAYFGIKDKNNITWLKNIEENSLEYFDESGIIQAIYHINGKILKCYYFAPFTSGKHTMTMLAILENYTNEEIVDFIDCEKNLLINRSSFKKGNNLHYQITLYMDGEKFEETNLEREIGFWQEFHSLEPAIPNKYKKLCRQSTAFLKMAQDRVNGQIIASLPPGEWSICWVRDMCYAIVALISANHLDEAKFGLEFLLNGKANQFKHFYYMGKDYGVGMDYFISICRYFGNGLEWSDELFYQKPKPVNELNNPNIEFDGFGLFLWAFSKYIKQSKDIKFLMDNIKKLKLTGQNILELIDEKVNLIKKDSSIWEQHLTLARHYLYTSITAAKGLKEFLDLLSLIDEDNPTYTFGYYTLINGINNSRSRNGVIRGSFEEKTKYFDASVVEAINFGVVDEFIGLTTIQGIEKKLYNGKGFKRTDNLASYDKMEWVFINMRMALAYLKYSEKEKAINLIDRTNSLAEANFNIIPELYDNDDSYTGQAPMIGYGAGAFIIAVNILIKNN
jgi:GH15 family glucan-1,4-alpha-glucosidase